MNVLNPMVDVIITVTTPMGPTTAPVTLDINLCQIRTTVQVNTYVRLLDVRIINFTSLVKFALYSAILYDVYH